MEVVVDDEVIDGEKSKVVKSRNQASQPPTLG